MFGEGLIHVRFVSSNHIDAPPAFHLDHAHVSADISLPVEELGQLTDRETVSRRNRVIRDERQLVAIRNRPFDVDAADRIRPIQNKHRKLHFRGLFEQVTERGNVRVEARADVLNVVHYAHRDL